MLLQLKGQDNECICTQNPQLKVSESDHLKILV